MSRLSVRSITGRWCTVAEPTPVVRAVTYERDRERCCSCGARVALQYQHRQATGMGGSKVRPRYEQGVTTCAVCNPRYESDLQSKALACGWKVRGWVKDCTAVPVFYAPELTWYELTADGRRLAITPVRASAMMRDVYGAEYEAWVEAAA
ncbi:MAG: hypothetical protein WED09_07350 [Homoserinimonas sp.]